MLCQSFRSSTPCCASQSGVQLHAVPVSPESNYMLCQSVRSPTPCCASQSGVQLHAVLYSTARSPTPCCASQPRVQLRAVLADKLFNKNLEKNTWVPSFLEIFGGNTNNMTPRCVRQAMQSFQNILFVDAMLCYMTLTDKCFHQNRKINKWVPVSQSYLVLTTFFQICAVLYSTKSDPAKCQTSRFIPSFFLSTQRCVIQREV